MNDIKSLAITPLTVQSQLYTIRNAAGLSRRDIAEATGCSERIIAYWENEQRFMTWQNAIKVLPAYGIKITLELKP